MIRIQQQDFDLGAEYQALRERSQGDGAIVTFTGLVREWTPQGQIEAIFLEHYPAMTQQALQHIVDQARDKWPLGAITVIHRIGEIKADEQIVFVGVTSKHRQAAFEAAQYIMDFLKTQAPLWKKEIGASEAFWVAAKDSDQQAVQRWQK